MKKKTHKQKLSKRQRHLWWLRKKNKKRLNTLIAKKAKCPHCVDHQLFLRNYEGIRSPEVLDLELNYEDSISFFNKIRYHSNNYNDKFKLNFIPLKSITPAAALILVAELYRYKVIKKAKLRVLDFERWDENIKIQFRDMGLFSLLQINNLPENFKQIESQNIEKFIEFEVHDTSDEKLKEFQERIIAIVPIPNQPSIHNGITEAIINSRKHAYPDGCKNRLKKKLWWAVASYNLNNNKLSIIVYDQGVGIPETFHKKNLEEYKWYLKFLKILKKPKDSDIIKMAMEPGKSSTGKVYRGRGSKDIKDYIEKTGNSMLRVISLKGEYIYSSNKNIEQKNHSNPVKGTLIEWEVIVEKQNGK